MGSFRAWRGIYQKKMVKNSRYSRMQKWADYYKEKKRRKE